MNVKFSGKHKYLSYNTIKNVFLMYKLNIQGIKP
jgi:hypothetical protein